MGWSSGKSGFYSTPGGLKLAFVSTTAGAEDIEAMIALAGRPSYAGTDILVTALWPTNVTDGAPVQPVRVFNCRVDHVM